MLHTATNAFTSGSVTLHAFGLLAKFSLLQQPGIDHWTARDISETIACDKIMLSDGAPKLLLKLRNSAAGPANAYIYRLAGNALKDYHKGDRHGITLNMTCDTETGQSITLHHGDRPSFKPRDPDSDVPFDDSDLHPLDSRDFDLGDFDLDDG